MVVMRGALLLVSIVSAGCFGHQTNRARVAGSTVVVVTNATPIKLCELQLAPADDPGFGDNWLGARGLASGQSLEVKLKPGTYKATWTSCKQGDAPYYAGVLIDAKAFEITGTSQLFAYVADKVAPTRRAPVRPHHALIRFQGQQLGGTAPVDDDAADDASVATAEPEPAADLTGFIDRRAARDAKRGRTRPKASLGRVHDLADGRSGYAERTRR